MIIDIDTPLELTAYADIFDGKITLPIYTSLFQFFVSESYRGYNEEYRQFILTLESPEIIDLESRYIGIKQRNPAWAKITPKVIDCMAWFLVINHFDAMVSMLRSGESIELGDEISLAVSKVFNSMQANNYISAGIIVTPSLTDHHLVRSQLETIIPTDEIDILVYGNDRGSISKIEPFAISHYLPVARFELSDWRESYSSIKDAVDHVAILCKENELDAARSVANQFIEYGVHVCLRVC